MNLLSGKSYLTRTHAKITPKMLFIKVAMNEHIKLTLYADSNLLLVMVSKKLEKFCPEVYTTTDATGISTIILNIASVTPKDNLKLGITLIFLLFLFFIISIYLIYLVEHSTIGKMFFMYCVPTTKDIIININ